MHENISCEDGMPVNQKVRADKEEQFEWLDTAQTTEATKRLALA